jgi:hypothetical protein
VHGRVGCAFFPWEDVKSDDAFWFWIGLMAMPRTPIARSPEDSDDISDEEGAVDASLLPPG